MNRNALFCIIAVVSALSGQTIAHSAVTHKTSNSFKVPHSTKRLGLLGCTPHPAQYIKTHGYNRKKMRTIQLADFLDVDYLRDSFDQVLLLCKQHNIDHLLIAYLPVYFIDMHELVHHQFVTASSRFLRTIVPQMEQLIKEEVHKLDCNSSITIVVPPRSSLKRVPQHRIPLDERIRYLIKQFPHLNGISSSDLDTLVIINNQGEDDQNENIIRYLKYEYLFEKPLKYETININKPKFHQYT